MKSENAEPLCPVFSECGGCSYQHLAYQDELTIKEKELKSILREKIDLEDDLFEPIVASPQAYHYRNRLDLKLVRTKAGEVFIGFSPRSKGRVIPVETCFIAEKRIADYIPTVKTEAIAKLPAKKYRQANLVVRTGDDQKVLWGGIGRRSCQLDEAQYFWAEINGKKIFYSLDTFFQANLSILSLLFSRLEQFDCWKDNTVLLDLYGGVGLFSIGLSDRVRDIVLMEESISSLRLAEYNKAYHDLSHLSIIPGKVEEALPGYLTDHSHQHLVALVDPPRAGLSEKALKIFVGSHALDALFYLSCQPAALARDLKSFTKNNWTIKRIMPFDFFPKTKHLETLVLLQSDLRSSKKKESL